jgi:tetratricopeptide (TPR) repeat protein
MGASGSIVPACKEVFMSSVSAPGEQSERHYQTAIAAICEIAEDYYRLGKLGAALNALQAGTLLLDHAPQQQTLDENRATLLLQQGKLLATNGFYANSGHEAAVAALLRAQELATASGNEMLVADALQWLGQAHYNKALNASESMLTPGEDRYKQPLDYFQQALAKREALLDTRGVAESLFYAGLIYERWGQRDIAHSYYTKALTLAEKYGYTLEQSYALRHLAGLAQQAGDLEQALTFFSESLALREAAGYTILLPLSHIAVGDVLVEQYQMAEAKAHYETAYTISQGIEAPLAHIVSLLSLGMWYKEQREFAQAHSYFEQTYAGAQAIDLPMAMAEARKALDELARLENKRETITTSAEARGRNVIFTEPPIYGDVWLRVEPLERGKGVEFISVVAEEAVPSEYIKPIEEGVRVALQNGVLQGYPITDVRVTLFGGSYHEVDSSAWAFKKAGSMALKAAVEQANPIVLEPDTH